jgi:hypothetical protein
MTDTPPDWVLIEAAKRAGGNNTIEQMRGQYRVYPVYRALCDMIAKHEQKPVDRKVLCAREAMLLDTGTTDICVRAIELYLEGYGE